jgi:hypothetical protein
MHGNNITRRKAVQRIGLLAGLALVPGSLWAFHQKHPRLQLHALGSMSANLVETLIASGLETAHTCSLPEQIILDNQHTAAQEEATMLRRLQNQCTTQTAHILIADLNNPPCFHLADQLYHWLQNNNTPPLLIGLLPFRFESHRKRQLAENQRDQLIGKSHCHFIDLEKYRQSHGHLLLPDFFDHIALHIRQHINTWQAT